MEKEIHANIGEKMTRQDVEKAILDEEIAVQIFRNKLEETQ